MLAGTHLRSKSCWRPAVPEGETACTSGLSRRLPSILWSTSAPDGGAGLRRCPSPNDESKTITCHFWRRYGAIEGVTICVWVVRSSEGEGTCPLADFRARVRENFGDDLVICPSS